MWFPAENVDITASPFGSRPMMYSFTSFRTCLMALLGPDSFSSLIFMLTSPLWVIDHAVVASGVGRQELKNGIAEYVFWPPS